MVLQRYADFGPALVWTGVLLALRLPTAKTTTGYRECLGDYLAQIALPVAP